MYYPIKNGVVEIDEDDLSLISCFNWHMVEFGKLNKLKYARTSVSIGKGKQRTIYMHRLIKGFPTEHIDHIDGNGLKNNKENLRTISHRENHNNRHVKYKRFATGAYYHKHADCWFSSIYYNGTNKSLFNYPDPISANIVYNIVKDELEE